LKDNPTIAFCTTCKGRLQHLERTLPKNLADNADYENLKFIILDYNSMDGLADYMHSNHKAAIESGRVSFYRFLEPTPFRMAHAKNLAHRLGILEGADILCNLDADNFTGQGFARYVSKIFQEPDSFLLARRAAPKDGGDLLPKGINGRTVVTRQAFLKIGGYNEKFAAWGPDDRDFNARLRRLGYTPHQIERQYLETGAILHNDRMRFREYPEAQNANESGPIDKSDTSTIANFGNFGRGIVFRNWDFSHPITLGDLPTRIFGIGMHKTATTSLHAALTILGYESAHWKSAHWAKAIWDEMKEGGRSLTLERSYAISDLPITLLYRELHAAYPGSKFILTIRKESEWLESVRNHWDASVNPYRCQWNHDPFTRRIHRELYGQTTFAADVFLARYRRHATEVRQFFENRPGELLESWPAVPERRFNSGESWISPGWAPLCNFLKQPYPAVPYPVEFVTKRSARLL
jgi:hypothetical protein